MDRLYSSLNGFYITFYIRTLLVSLHLRKWNQVVGCQSCLSTRWHKNNDWLVVRELFDVIISWFIHCSHTRTVMLFTETFKMNLNWNWTNCRSEVKKSILISTKPFGNISTIGHSCWQTNHSYFWLFIHSANNNFQDCTSLLS